MRRKIASFIENHILYWSTSRPKYHDKEEMEKPYPCIMFKNKEYISCEQVYLKKNTKKTKNKNKIYSKINIDKGYLPSSIYVDRGGNIGLYKF